MLDTIFDATLGRRLDAADFWKGVNRLGNCWLWTGSMSGARGSGRIAWELTRGPVPSSSTVGRHCGALRCVRPEHLYLTFTDTFAPLYNNKLSKYLVKNRVIDDEEDNLLTAFTMRGYLVVLKFETACFAVAVTTDAAQTKGAAKMVALRRARINDPKRTLGRLLGSRILRDTEEARFIVGIDDSEYVSDMELQNKKFDLTLQERYLPQVEEGPR